MTPKEAPPTCLAASRSAICGLSSWLTWAAGLVRGFVVAKRAPNVVARCRSCHRLQVRITTALQTINCASPQDDLCEKCSCETCALFSSNQRFLLLNLFGYPLVRGTRGQALCQLPVAESRLPKQSKTAVAWSECIWLGADECLVFVTSFMSLKISSLVSRSSST